MSDLFDYLKWRGDISLKQVPFGKIDALLLAHISYNIFDGLVPESFTKSITLNELLQLYRNSEDYENRRNVGALLNDKTSTLFETSAITERFSQVKICGYKSIIDLEKNEQFAAMIYSWGKTNYVVYRGTDDSIVGWKEDFNISFMEQIPSQKEALDYYNKASAVLKGDFVIIGHSKGGNLAVNTAVKCLPKSQKKISEVYNFDGPGFKKQFYEGKDFKAVEKKIKSFYPGFCIVGMIFEHPENYEIINCDATALYQHDPLSWQICGGSFENELDFTSESKFFYKTVNEWVERIEVKQREKVVNVLFDVIESSGAKTNTELVNNKIKASARMLETWTKLDRETKNEVHTIVRVLRECFKADIPLLNIMSIQK